MNLCFERAVLFLDECGVLSLLPSFIPAAVNHFIAV